MRNIVRELWGVGETVSDTCQVSLAVTYNLSMFVYPTVLMAHGLQVAHIVQQM